MLMLQLDSRVGVGTRAGDFSWLGIRDDFHGAFTAVHNEPVTRFNGG